MVDFDVVALPETDHVEDGDTAPDFERPLVNPEYWENTRLAELTEEHPVLLITHPMDGDFPATYIWQELDDRNWDELFDVTVVGLSISTPYEHSRFLDEWDLDHQLFSDPANEVAREYGIVHDLDGMAGVSEPRIAAFVIDTDRTIRYSWVSTEWPEFPAYDELEAALEALEA